MILVAIAVAISTSAGVWARMRYGHSATTSTDHGVDLFFWLVLPPLTYFVVANLELDSGLGLGIVASYVIMAIVGLTAYVVTSRVLELDRPSIGSTVNGSMSTNTGYLGIPLCATVLGHDAIGAAVIYDVALSGAFLWTTGAAVAAGFGTRAGEGARERITAFFTRNPVLVAAILGALAPDALAPQAATDVAKTCMTMILPVGFFMLGVHLMEERADGTFEFPPPMSKPVALMIALRLVVAPGLMLLSTLVIDVPDAYLLQAAMPTGVNSVLLAHVYGLNLRLAASAVAWTTAIALVVAFAASAIA